LRILLSSICLETGTDIQLALYYLKGFLLKQPSSRHSSLKVQIKVFNENQSVPGIVKQVLNCNPDVAGFSCYLWNIRKTLQVCRRLKRQCRSVRIVLGGPEATPRAAELIKKYRFIDVVVRGEGEEVFAQLAKILAVETPDLSSVKGITFRRGKCVISNPDMPHLADISVIPSPYLSGLVNFKTKKIVDIPLETTRGCVLRCGYCYYHKEFPGLRLMPLSRVRKELKSILSRKPREVYLMDATFNSCPERAKKILRLFIRHNQASNLHLELRAELVDPEMAGLLNRANAYNIEIGIQSTNPRTLRAVNRPLNIDKFVRGIQLLNKYKLFYEIQLIDALPFQGYSDLKKTLDWLYDLHPAKVSIFRLNLLPGTVLRQRAAEFGIKYQSQAPYRAIKTRSMSEADLKKVEKLQFAMERLYDSQVFQNTLYALRDKTGVKISQILEDWSAWEARQKIRGARYFDELNKKSPQFLKCFCRRHGKAKLYDQLLPQLLKDLPGY
jgi:radical SAM superfamily enzyme YgiQ (UPF0313 family)